MPSQEKTEAPTPRKRDELRKKGQTAQSTDFAGGVGFLSMFLVVSFLFPYIGQQAMLFSQKIWRGDIPYGGEDYQWLFNLLRICGGYFLRMVAPVALIALGIGLFIGFLQTGFVVSFEAIKPKFEYINPIKGLEKIFSMRTVIESLKVSLKVFVGIAITYLIVRGSLPQLADLMAMELGELLRSGGTIARRLGLYLGGLFLGIGFLDFFYQRYEFERKARMTKEEVKEEYKKTEGDPIIRSRIRAKQRELARSRMMQAVPSASVVVTNPVHVACALHYERNSGKAPVLVAKGKRLIAEKIKEIARECQIPVVENKKTAWDLYRYVDVGKEIPGFLYRAVAEILAFVYRMSQTGRTRT
ncbi:MAG TPA: EscU/YscU/HrcU family type III secretion system export apparatus switch protein [Atribacteraceae bacterium]|nr:EscU/YscU/HrcU family type III secretion system export apparatus switch protein [Atribacteraceae bacterium]